MVMLIVCAIFAVVYMAVRERRYTMLLSYYIEAVGTLLENANESQIELEDGTIIGFRAFSEE